MLSSSGAENDRDASLINSKPAKLPYKTAITNARNGVYVKTWTKIIEVAVESLSLR